MSRFGSLCILLLTALLMLLTMMACSEEDSAPLTPTTAPSSATASPAATTPEPTATPNQETAKEPTASSLSPTTGSRMAATPSLITIDCNDPRFTKQILELSEDNQNQFSPRILKLYSDVEEIERTESVLRCRGTATLSRGGESSMTYHYEIDRDGDAFIGYEIGDPIATPTPATSPSPGFTLEPVFVSGSGTSTAPVHLDAGLWLVQMAVENNGDDDRPDDEDNFMVHLESVEEDRREGLANEIVRSWSASITLRVGGRSNLPPGAMLLSVYAAGDWTVEFRKTAYTYPPTPTPAPVPPTPTPGPIATPADLVERVRDSVVRVQAGFFSSGSGFIFDVVGTTAFVGTNHHVIEDATAVDVVVRNNRTYEALVLGWDADRDVAVLAICCSEDFLVLPWGEASPDVGDEVVALGYPRGGTRGQVTATTGEVVQDDTLSDLYDFIPHTAPLNPGNSGGPLFSMPEAKVLGINTARGTDVLSFYAVPFQAIKSQMAEWRAQLVVGE